MSHNLVFGVSLLAILGKCAARHLPLSFQPHSALAKCSLSKYAQEISSECFDFYVPQLDKAAEEWSYNYGACVEMADKDRVTLIAQIEQNESSILQTSNEVVSNITKCQTITDDLEFFNCFSGLNQNVLSAIYTISNSATIDAALLNQQLNGIDVSMYLCTNATEDAYVQHIAAINDALNYCLKYGLPDTEEITNKRQSN